jgi:hypothetical protein
MFSDEASKIASSGVSTAQRCFGDQAAFDMALAFLIAYAAVLNKLVGSRKAAEVVYIVGDTIATPEGGA